MRKVYKINKNEIKHITTNISMSFLRFFCNFFEQSMHFFFYLWTKNTIEIFSFVVFEVVFLLFYCTFHQLNPPFRFFIPWFGVATKFKLLWCACRNLNRRLLKPPGATACETKCSREEGKFGDNP